MSLCVCVSVFYWCGQCDGKMLSHDFVVVKWIWFVKWIWWKSAPKNKNENLRLVHAQLCSNMCSISTSETFAWFIRLGLPLSLLKMCKRSRSLLCFESPKIFEWMNLRARLLSRAYSFVTHGKQNTARLLLNFVILSIGSKLGPFSLGAENCCKP